MSCRFIRYDANEALDAFYEHCSVTKVIGTLAKLGVGHKNVVARTASGRILANMCQVLGAGCILQAEAEDAKQKESVHLLFTSLACLMSDGSLDVRQEAKRGFSALVSHDNFSKVLTAAVPSQVLQKIHKPLQQLKT